MKKVRDVACAIALCLCASGVLAAPPSVSASSWMNSGPLGDAELDHRVVLLDFWAVWCIPCVRNLQTMQAYADAFKGQPFTLIGVHYAEAPNIQMYLRDQGIQFPIAVDKGDTFQRFGIVVIPTYILIDKEGNLRSTSSEPPSKERIAELLAEAYSIAFSGNEIVVKDEAGNVVTHVASETEASVTDTKGGRTFVVRVSPHADGSAEAMLDVTENGKMIQRSVVSKAR